MTIRTLHPRRPAFRPSRRFKNDVTPIRSKAAGAGAGALGLTARSSAQYFQRANSGRVPPFRAQFVENAGHVLFDRLFGHA